MTNLKNNKKIVSIFSPSLQKLLLFSLIILIWATYWKIRFQDKRKGRSISVKHHCSEDFVKLTSRLGSHFKLGFAPLQSTVGSWNHEILSAKQLQLLFIWQTQLIFFPSAFFCDKIQEDVLIWNLYPKWGFFKPQ